MRREVAARAGVHRHVERHRHRERPHRVGLRLLLEGHGQHPLVHARLDERRGDDRGRAADRAGGVHADQRLARGAERLGEEQLGHHHALEQVGRLADDDRVDVVEADVGVGRAPGRSPRGTGRRSRRPRAWPGGGSGPRRSRRLAASPSVARLPSRTRGSAGVPARWSRGRAPWSPSPDHTFFAASPKRIRPPVNIGLPASGPPEGLIATSSARPSSLRRISSWWLNGACSSATSTPSRSDAGAARAVEGERVRSRVPMLIGSTYVERLVIHAGRSRHVAGPVVGGQHDRGGTVGHGSAVVLAQRVGVHRPVEQLLDRGPALADGVLVLLGVGERTVHHLGHRPLVPEAGVDARAGLEAGERDGVGPQRRHRVGVELERERTTQHAGRALAEAVDQRGVDLAGLDLDPRLVERPRGVHLDVRLVDRRDHPDRVDGLHERERPPGQVVRGPGAPEADVATGPAGLLVAARRRGGPAAPRTWATRRTPPSVAGRTRRRRRLSSSSPQRCCL